MTKYVMQVNQTNGVHIALSVGTEISKGGMLDCDQLSVRSDMVTYSITTFKVVCRDSWGWDRCSRKSYAYILIFSCIGED